MRATDGTLRIALVGKSQRIVERFAIASTAFAFAIGTFLLTRRVAGAFSFPLPVLPLLVTALAVTAWAIVVRELSGRNAAFTAFVLAVVLMFALACSHPGARIIDWLVWPTALVAAAILPIKLRRPSPRDVPDVLQNSNLERTDDADSEKILQQLTRVRLNDGGEAIRGLLVAEFSAGERQAILYVAFCPPFESLPQVDVNLADDSEATLKLVQKLHNGAQLEVRLPQPAAIPTNVTVEFFATDTEEV